MAYKIILIDDQPLFLELAKSIFYDDPRVAVVGETTSVKSGIELINKLNPDMVILDVHMSDMNGFEAVKVLLAASQKLKIIMTSSHDEPEYHELAISTGAVGFIAKKALSVEAVLTTSGLK